MFSNKLCTLSLRSTIYCTPQKAHIDVSISSPSWRLICAAGVKNLTPPRKFDDVEFPAERRRLRTMERAPQPIPGQKLPKMPKKLIDMRGPELVHNKLIHEQYGIRALQGGQIRHGHIEMMRLGINRNFDESRMFAIWRFDAPWKAVTKKGQGHRMGGGKGAIDHYVTPIKEGRIMLELAGYAEFAEVYPLLSRVADKLPFKAEAISQDLLAKEQEEERKMVEENMNPFTFKYALDRNLNASHHWASPYDFIWYGRYR